MCSYNLSLTLFCWTTDYSLYHPEISCLSGLYFFCLKTPYPIPTYSDTTCFSGPTQTLKLMLMSIPTWKSSLLLISFCYTSSLLTYYYYNNFYRCLEDVLGHKLLEKVGPMVSLVYYYSRTQWVLNKYFLSEWKSVRILLWHVFGSITYFLFQ